MIYHFPSPILSVAPDVVRDLQGEEALCNLWTLFTKCKESLKDGRRLENISWRLWYRELASAQSTPSSSPGSLSPSFSEKRSPSPITPISDDGQIHTQVPLPHPSLSPAPNISAAHSWHAQHAATTVMTAGRRLSTASVPMERQKSHSPLGVGQIILDILPSSKLDVDTEKASRLPTVPLIAQPRPQLPTVQLPVTPPQPGALSFPRVVVVNPTPHPTPPATPSIPHAHPAATQPSTHLLPPPPARSLVSATNPALRGAATKPPSPPKAAPPSLLSIAKPPPLDGLPAKPKAYNDDTLKASDRRFFLQDGGSPSPDGLPTKAPEREQDKHDSEHEHEHERDLGSPCSETSSQLKSEITGHTSAAAGAGARRARAGVQVQVRKSKERHGPARPALQRFHSHGPRGAAAQKKERVVGEMTTTTAAAVKKGTTFNIGSVSSNGSRSGRSTREEKEEKVEKAEKEKEKKSESQLTRTRPASPNPNPTVPAAGKLGNGHGNGNTGAHPTISAKTKVAAAGTNGAGPSHQRRGIVVSTSSEYETTDTDDDSEWASEDSTEDREAARKRQAAEDARTREAAEAQRQRDMFAKVPKRSYSNLNRTRSGLLSQLLNPDPSIFPPNHPYRTSHSTQDMTQWARQGGGSMLQMSKSSAAVPLAAQVTAQAPVAHSSTQTQTQSQGQGPRQNGGGNGGNGNGYRPKGRPQGEELEDTESDDENPDDTIQVSRSLAQQKLAALADPNRRRYSDRPGGPSMLSQQAQAAGITVGRVATAPIPLSHPYNLPAPEPPMTPRATRRQMLQTELSESLRRNLLWERQVSRANLNAPSRRPGGGALGNGLRPLTAMNSADGARASQPQPQIQPQQVQHQHQQQQQDEGDDREERKRRAMARNRSWADDFHYSGW